MFEAIKRGLVRDIFLLAIGIISIYLAELIPVLFGELGAPLLRGFGLCFVGLAAGDFSLRVLQPHVNTYECYKDAIENKNIAAGLLYVGRMVIMGIVLFLVATASRAEEMPVNAVKYTPVLESQRTIYWKDMKLVSLLAAQIEQETCNSLTSKTCWSPKAELLTKREQGVGFGQATRAFNPITKQIRFDTLADVVNKYPKDLKGYNWNNWSDPILSMRFYVLMMRDTTNNIKNTYSQSDQFEMALSAYNGGPVALSNMRLSCRAKVGCSYSKWFNNVENCSTKSKTVIPGYGGQSPYSINRDYVRNIVLERRNKYKHLDLV